MASTPNRFHIFFLALPIACVGAREVAYPYARLEQAWRGLGFDPKEAGCSFFVVCADPHIRKPEAPEFPPEIITEVNAFEPPPAFFLINGDLITNASSSFGQRPGEAQKERAREEFRILRRGLSKLRAEISVKLTLGNHDTYPYEQDAQLFRSVFPEHEVYDSFDLAGMHFVLLNGGQSGDLDAAQLAWLKQDAAALPKNRSVMLFVHQPSLGSTVNERGIPAAVRAAFGEHKGNLWLIGGHVHTNRETVFALPQTTIVQASITTCSGEIWGGPEHPGYWVFCIRDGHVCGRIFRRLGEGFRIDAPPDRTKGARNIVLPFEKTPGVIWEVLVGDGDRQYLVRHKAADVVTWWGYTSELVYRFPIAGLREEPTHLAVLANLYHAHREPEKRGAVDLATDEKHWQNADLPGCKHGVYLVPIPDACREGRGLFVRVRGPGYRSGVSVGGFALCRITQRKTENRKRTEED